MAGNNNVRRNIAMVAHMGPMSKMITGPNHDIISYPYPRLNRLVFEDKAIVADRKSGHVTDFLQT